MCTYIIIKIALTKASLKKFNVKSNLVKISPKAVRPYPYRKSAPAPRNCGLTHASFKHHSTVIRATSPPLKK